MIKKIVPKLEEFYNKFPLNESNLKYIINEIYGQVNNIDEIIDELINGMKEKLLITKDETGYEFIGNTSLLTYIKSDYYNLSNGGILPYKEYSSKFKVDCSYVVSTINFILKIMVSEDNDFYDIFSNEDIFYNGSMSPPDFMLPSRRNYYISLNIPAFRFEKNNNIYIGEIKFENVLRHELTHYFQDRLNPVHNDQKKNAEYNKYYKNTIDNMKYNMDDEVVKNLNFILYFFVDEEILANANALTGQMKQLNANRDNYTTIFNRTRVGISYNKVLADINSIFNDNSIKWPNIRQKLQDVYAREYNRKNVFNDNSIIGKSKDPVLFKKNLYKYIINKKQYCDKQFNKSIIYSIGGYQGKDPSKTYSTHNTRIT